MPTRTLRSLSVCLLSALTLVGVFTANAQVSGPPSARCHETDGTFTTCPGDTQEWSDVTPAAFPASKSFLYVNQDAAHQFLYLMYDFPFRTAQIGPTDSVHVSFYTVEQQAGSPVLITYDVYIMGNGQMQILQQGKPTPPGRILSAAGFHPSPNSSTPHLMAELQVPLSQGPPSTYSPDPLYWSASVPPTPPPPPDPPSCPVTVLGVCVKTQAQIDAWTQEGNAADNAGLQILSTEMMICNQPLIDLVNQLDEGVEKLSNLINIAQKTQAGAEVEGELAVLETETNELLQDYQTSEPDAFSAEVAALTAAARLVVSGEAAAAIASVLAEAAVVAAYASAAYAAYVALQTGACYLDLNAQAALDFAQGQFFATLAADPPDSNYTVIAKPVVTTLSVQPLTASAGFNSQVTADLNSLFSNLEQQIALLQVIPTTINRVSGAVAAGSAQWQAQQAQAAQTYATQLIPLLQNEETLNAALTKDFQASGVQLTFSSATVLNTLAQFRQNGFPAGFTAALTQLGVDATTQASILKSVIATSPASVASLGTGAFPQALSDPALTATTNAAISALTELAAVPPATSLTESLKFTIAGDYTAAGIGLRGNTSGNIAIAKIPAGATVQKAVLYWGMLDNGEDATLKQLTFNNNPITGTRIGSGPDTCWGRTNSFTYRADVTPFVAGNGTYALSNVASGGSILPDGASLVIVYQVAGAPLKTIFVDDGNISIPLGTSTGTASFGAFTAASPVSATTTYVVGDGQGFGSNTTFTGSAGTISFPAVFQGLDGAYWDTDTFNVSSAIGAGSDAGSAQISVTGDCLLWSAQPFSVASTTASTQPVIATAGVVEAGANGDTVVNLRGLDPGDAPTLQDQIQAIVQFRIIQNPSISGPALTAQLVNGLVSDGVIPASEAASIETAVNSQVVTPQPAISLISTATSLSISPSSNLKTGEPLTLNVTVTASSGNAIPSGTVTFASPDGSATITAPLGADGKLAYKATVPAPGTWSLYATYNGSSVFAKSVSPTLTQIVTAP